MPMVCSMEGRCQHGMEPSWCYLCHLETADVDSRVIWGLEDDEGPTLDDWETWTGPMPSDQERYLRFLCAEFGVPFDETLREGEAAVVIISFLEEPMLERQARTLTWLSEHAGVAVDERSDYAAARATIRRLVALRGLRSA